MSVVPFGDGIWGPAVSHPSPSVFISTVDTAQDALKSREPLAWSSAKATKGVSQAGFRFEFACFACLLGPNHPAPELHENRQSSGAAMSYDDFVDLDGVIPPGGTRAKMSKVIGIAIVAAALAACDVSPTGPTGIAPTSSAFAYPSPQVAFPGLIPRTDGQSHVILPDTEGYLDWQPHGPDAAGSVP